MADNSSMSSAENMGFQVKILDGNKKRKPCDLQPLTLAKVIDWIEAKRLDPKVKEELKKSAANYPQQALSNWQNNFSLHLEKIQNIMRSNPASKELVELQHKPVKEEYYEESVPVNDFDSGWEDSSQN